MDIAKDIRNNIVLDLNGKVHTNNSELEKIIISKKLNISEQILAVVFYYKKTKSKIDVAHIENIISDYLIKLLVPNQSVETFNNSIMNLLNIFLPNCNSDMTISEMLATKKKNILCQGKFIVSNYIYIQSDKKLECPYCKNHLIIDFVHSYNLHCIVCNKNFLSIDMNCPTCNRDELYYEGLKVLNRSTLYCKSKRCDYSVSLLRKINIDQKSLHCPNCKRSNHLINHGDDIIECGICKTFFSLSRIEQYFCHGRVCKKPLNHLGEYLTAEKLTIQNISNAPEISEISNWMNSIMNSISDCLYIDNERITGINFRLLQTILKVN